MEKFITLTAVSASIILFVTGYLHVWAKTPLAQFSHTTGECVAVYGGDGATCDNLPRKYIHEWVE